ncbi:hypothetical protein V5O48_006191 [Marasmius crinis-equi]|uniref:Carboxylic ester hydrolase n=1 Tax=Marasmius crinis-equi TaxID=585013 RepID=A0ABR3FK43_9AGAR
MRLRDKILLGLLSFFHPVCFSFSAALNRPEVILAGTRVVGIRNHGQNVDLFGVHDLLDDVVKGIPSNTVTEDCLTLNIFRPSETSVNYTRDKLPVLFWIFGGGWIIGSAGRYNGTGLVSRSITRGTPIIVIAANYRLGPLGFPQGEEAADEGVISLGLRDNLVALQWVKSNIEAFGGDPTKVTIFGESAGGRSIDLLLYNEQINDLASGAILESDGGTPILEPALTNEAWSIFVNAVAPCSHTANTSRTFECLRGKDVSSDLVLQGLIDAGVSFVNPKTNWGPLLDGEDGLLPDLPSQLPIKAKFPIIIGNCLDEGTLVQSQAPTNVSSDDMIRGMIRGLSARPPGREDEVQQIIDRVLAAYPNIPSLGSPFDTGNNTFGLYDGYKRAAAVAGDYVGQSHRRFMLKRLAGRSNAQVYSYLFADHNDGVVTTPREFILGSPVPGSLGVTHASEIFYVFGTLEAELGPENVAVTALDLSQTVMDYWISFAVNGDPNDDRGAQRPRWEPYSPTDPMIIQLKGQDTCMISDTFREKETSVFNEDPITLRR